MNDLLKKMREAGLQAEEASQAYNRRKERITNEVLAQVEAGTRLFSDPDSEIRRRCDISQKLKDLAAKYTWWRQEQNRLSLQILAEKAMRDEMQGMYQPSTRRTRVPHHA